MSVYDLPERWRGCEVPVNNFPTNKILAKWFLNIIIRLTEIIWYDFGNRHRKAPQESQTLPTTCRCQAWSYHNKVPQRGKCPATCAPFTQKKKKNNPLVYFYIYAFLLYIDSSILNFLCTGHKSFVSHWCSKLNDIGLSVVWSTLWIYFFYYLAAFREI